jgi:hypothetical protein
MPSVVKIHKIIRRTRFIPDCYDPCDTHPAYEITTKEKQAAAATLVGSHGQNGTEI